jgi:hypothetical protein
MSINISHQIYIRIASSLNASPTWVARMTAGAVYDDKKEYE